jgi:hypothetical protein
MGGYRYVLTHAKARETLQVCARLGNASAQLFAGLATGRGGSRITNAIVYLMSSPDLGPTLEYVTNAFSPYTQVQDLTTGNSVTLRDCLDVHFAGRMSDLGKWIEAAVEFECGDFLGEQVERFAVALGIHLKADKSESPSPKPAETNGSSGA